MGPLHVVFPVKFHNGHCVAHGHDGKGNANKGKGQKKRRINDFGSQELQQVNCTIVLKKNGVISVLVTNVSLDLITRNRTNFTTLLYRCDYGGDGSIGSFSTPSY